jgi:hypothetical protein
MEPNSLADSMRDIEEGLPQTYTAAPPGANDLYTQHLLAQVDQLRDANQSLLEDNCSLRQALPAKDHLIVSKDPYVWSDNKAILLKFLAFCRAELAVDGHNFAKIL